MSSHAVPERDDQALAILCGGKQITFLGDLKLIISCLHLFVFQLLVILVAVFQSLDFWFPKSPEAELSCFFFMRSWIRLGRT